MGSLKKLYGWYPGSSGGYLSVYPVAQNGTYVKATTKYSTDYWAYFTTDPTKSLTGAYTGNQWVSADLTKTNQRLHIDLGSAIIVKRIYYENGHSLGSVNTCGVKNFTFQGSNTAAAFAELTYATDTNWTNITTAQSTFDIHVALDQADPKYILVTNNTGYRYYAFKFADNWTANYMGVRRIELQIVLPPTVGLFLPIKVDSVGRIIISSS